METGPPGLDEEPQRVAVKTPGDVDTMAAEHAALKAKNEALLDALKQAKENAALAQENARLAEELAQARQSASTAGGPKDDYSSAMMNPAMMFPPPWPPAYPGMPGMAGMPPGYFPPSGGYGRSATEKSGRSGHGRTPNNRFGYTSTGKSERSFGVTASMRSAGSDGMDDDEMRMQKRPTKPLEGPKTTAMMKNIPNDYTRDLLLVLIDQAGFEGSYDLVYLPIDFKSEVGLGYAFINFVSPEEAQRFQKHFQGFKSWSVPSEKVCEVCESDKVQGKDNNIARYRNSPIMHESIPDNFKPALFEDGKRIEFPEPTKTIRPPRKQERRPENRTDQWDRFGTRYSQ